MNAIKILIVEDEILISKQLSRYLEKREYQVIGSARSGEKALEIIEQDNPDIVLMDIDLDGELDGVETATKIHETLLIPIIYLTNFNDSRTLSRVKDTLPAAYLTKPFKNHDVRNAIEMAISSLSLLSQNKANDVNVNLEILLKKQNNESDHVFLLKDRIFVRNIQGDFDRLFLDQIVYMESADHSTNITTLHGILKVNVLFKHLMDLLKDYPMFRIHRQIAVNANFVYNISRNEIKIEYTNKTTEEETLIQKTLPISTTYRQDTFSNFRVALPKK